MADVSTASQAFNIRNGNTGMAAIEDIKSRWADGSMKDEQKNSWIDGQTKAGAGGQIDQETDAHLDREKNGQTVGGMD